MGSVSDPFDTQRRLAGEDADAYRRERRRLIEEHLQSRAGDALDRLQEEIDWLYAMNVDAAAGWPEIRDLLREAVDGLADRVNLLARELAERKKT